MSQEQGPPMVTGWTAPGMTEEATEMAFELEGGAKLYSSYPALQT